MKIACISDTHGKVFHDIVPECDILLHCGDISPMHDHSISFQKQWFQDTFIPDLKLVPAKHIVFIGGNHDFYLYETFKNNTEGDIKFNLPENVHYLRDNSVTIEGIKIHGTPWVHNLPNWGFNTPNEQFADNMYMNINRSPDILMTHGPAFGYCDTIKQYKLKDRLGHPVLLQHILRTSPQVVICGHIHSGNHNRELLYLDNGARTTSFFNVSLLDEGYNIAYKPKILKYKKGEIKWT